jgi:N-acetylglucosamine-6-phosphate deacetylase
MDQGINHLLDWLDLPPQQTWAMATLNPANVVGLRQKGRLDIGADADLVLWDQSDGRFVPAQSWIAGRCVWKNDSINDPNEKEEQP